MTASVRARLRHVFHTAAAAVTLAMTSMSGVAQTTPVAPTTNTTQNIHGWSSHRDQGQCPVIGANTNPVIVPFNFAANPREQQRLLENIGFVIGRETPDGVFRERTLQSVNEFRQLYYGPTQGAIPFAQSMTADELTDLRDFAERVQRERKQYGLTLDAAVALRFATRATDAVYADLVTETAKGRSGFSGSMADFLYLVKTNADKYGLRYFADRIEITRETNGTAMMRINDPATFMLTDALRRHPRIGLIMEAERIRLDENMPTTDYQRGTTPTIIPLNRLQGDLLTLGFDIGGIDNNFGPKTEAAYHLYRALYAPLVPQGQNVDAYMVRFADLAQRDARSYGVSTTAAAAIRLGSLRTGVDFEYMMELSSAESNFDHNITASTSSATGLFQFTEDTWLQTIRRYGAWYGMEQLSLQMNNTFDMNGLLVGRVENPFIRTTAFDLRTQPHIMALLAAEFQVRNQFRITCVIPRQLTRTEMYLGHFLGAEGAITFLQKRASTPNAQAARTFQLQAEANRTVFYSRDRKGRRIGRSYTDVYQFFDRKFGNGAYRDNGAVKALGLALRTPQEAHTAATPAGYNSAAVSSSNPTPSNPVITSPTPIRQ